MAKTKNSGFSMIEIIIAISILTLLLTPIIHQLTNTMNINRKAKEQQYENENAEYVLEYFQSQDLENIPATATDGIYYNESSSHIVDKANGLNKTCEIWYIDGNNILQLQNADGTFAQVDYSSYKYVLNNVKLGSKQTEYSRTVVLDDLSNKIKELKIGGHSYRVAYSISDEVLNNASGWTRTSEGSLVKDTDNDGCYDAIVCKQISETDAKDPNSVNIGNMHNLDSANVALITGYSTNFDRQVSDDFYALTMSYMRNSDNENMKTRWEAEVEEPGTYLHDEDYLSGMSKLTYIKINQDVTRDVFEIQVNVTYENIITLESESFTVTKTYPAFSQEFAYDVDDDEAVCPEIYYEYQPYVVSNTVNGSEKYVEYVANDYFLIENTVEGAKMYFFKPSWDQVLQTFHPGIVTNNDDTTSTVSAAAQTILAAGKDASSHYLTSYYVYNHQNDENHESVLNNHSKVRINIGSVIDPSSAIYKNVEIYTNMDPRLSITETSDYAYNNPQFVVNDHDAYSTKFKTESGAQRVVYDLKDDSIKKFEDEENSKDRLYTITVTLTPVDGTIANTVILTGAKGGK